MYSRLSKPSAYCLITNFTICFKCHFARRNDLKVLWADIWILNSENGYSFSRINSSLEAKKYDSHACHGRLKQNFIIGVIGFIYYKTVSYITIRQIVDCNLRPEYEVLRGA